MPVVPAILELLSPVLGPAKPMCAKALPLAKLELKMFEKNNITENEHSIVAFNIEYRASFILIMFMILCGLFIRYWTPILLFAPCFPEIAGISNIELPLLSQLTCTILFNSSVTIVFALSSVIIFALA